jgi:hypothetical protein
VIARLEEAGILVREAQGRRGVGRPPARRWHVKTSSVNPGNAEAATDPHDPERFRKPLPPGFSLVELHRQMGEQKSASVNSPNSPPLTGNLIDAIEEHGRMVAADKSASVNSERSDDPDRFQRPLPPDFDLYAVLTQPQEPEAEKSASVNSPNAEPTAERSLPAAAHDPLGLPRQLPRRRRSEGSQAPALPTVATKKLRPPWSPATTPLDFPFPYDDGIRVWTKPGVYWRKRGAPGPEYDYPPGVWDRFDDAPIDDDEFDD